MKKVYGKYVKNLKGEYILYNGYYLWLSPDGAIYHKFQEAPQIYVKKGTTEYNNLMKIMVNRRELENRLLAN